jgi:hypothetical protein
MQGDRGSSPVFAVVIITSKQAKNSINRNK